MYTWFCNLFGSALIGSAFVGSAMVGSTLVGSAFVGSALVGLTLIVKFLGVLMTFSLLVIVSIQSNILFNLYLF